MAISRKPYKPERPRKTTKPNVHVTRSGQTIKLQQSFMQRYIARRDRKELQKAEMLRDMPKGRMKRIAYRLNPKRQYKYWFSKEGGIMALKIIGIGLVASFVLILGIFAYFRKDLPNLKDISGSNIGGSIRYYDKTGQTLLWEDYSAVKRIPVQSDQISQFMKDATVAVEDRDFYKHGGFDLKGIIRAGVANVSGGATSQGGSTITQQLVKLTQDWTKDRTYSRKIKELILSVELERSYSKDEILTGYLNAAPYGNIEYGVEAASRDYFKKSAKDLTLDEAVFLAAIPKSPSYYSPYGPYFTAGGKGAVVDRQHYALDVMLQLGKITKKQHDDAFKIDTLAKVNTTRPNKYGNITAPYFVLAAKEQLESKFEQTYKRGGWKVITTLDLDLQKLADKSLSDGQAQMRRQSADNAAFVAEDNQTGQVVALIGGVDFANTSFGQINYARDVNISPGSSIKPYDYTTYIENNTNVGAGSVLYDQVGPLPGYPCTDTNTTTGNCLNDYDRVQNSGPLTLRYALGGSRNIPAAKAMLSSVAGDASSGHTKSINKVLATASALMSVDDGYHCYRPGTDVTTATSNDETQCYTSAAIGDGAYLHLNQHVNGIASIARLGKSIPQTFIIKVTDGSNKVIDQFSQPLGTQVVRPDAAFIVSDMASDPKASYLGGSCTDTDCYGMKFHRYKGWHTAIKTGTTNDLFDGLMVNWNTKYTTGIWVGNHTRTIPYTGQPENMTDPIMKQFMEGAIDLLGNTPAVNWTQPADIKVAPAYVMTHKIFNAQSIPNANTDFYPAWYQSKTTTTKKQTIDVISNKIATECTPDLAKKYLDSAGAKAFSGDTFVAGASAVTDEKDDVHICSDSKPTVSLTVNTSTGNSYEIVATIGQGTHDLAGNTDKGAGKVNILVDGTNVQSFDILAGNLNYQTSYSPTTSGNHTVTAQVIDSVLYDATSSSQTISPINLTQSTTATNVVFTWTATSSSGDVSIFTSSGTSSGTLICKNGGGTCSKPKAIVTEGTTVYARDESGNSSPTITVKY
jgi:membrane peptidoglycan carboxypeptidase